MARQTLTDALRIDIEELITTGELPPGTALDEVRLAEQFKVSRTPVREALRQLAAADLVQIRPRHAPIVAALSLPNLLQMFEVMAELEGLCARLAARRRGFEVIERLEAAQNEMRMAMPSNVKQFYKYNQEFHELIYEASANPYLSDQTRTLRNRLAPYRIKITDQPGRMSASIAEHQAVIDAIATGDAEAAATAMRNHVNLLGEGLTDFVASLPPELVTPVSQAPAGNKSIA